MYFNAADNILDVILLFLDELPTGRNVILLLYLNWKYVKQMDKWIYNVMWTFLDKGFEHCRHFSHCKLSFYLPTCEHA